MENHASMNRIYRLVWNAALNLWVAVAENAKGRGKAGSGRSTVGFASVLAALALLAPPGQLAYAASAADATVTLGAGSVATTGNTTTINQTSQKLAIDWTSLSTRANEALVFNQPNAQAIALNRITGSSPSELLGSLTANGQVFILNPNGVLFGAGSQVNVGGLVASTLNLSNADFEAGSFNFTGNGSQASVVNQGSMSAASGGYLALLAPEVRNQGMMSATLGSALLAAGNKTTLTLHNGSLLGYSIDQGAVNALADNQHLIQADGGQVLLSARAMDALTTATVNNTGVIEARTIQNQAGRILLMGDMQTGTVNVGGRLNASAPDGGNGGFVETSAAHVKIAAGTRVTTLAASGQTGTWLIDPVDFTIAAGSAAQDASGMGADTLAANLNNGNVSIATSATTAGNGDIFVNSAVSWSADSVLSLTAQRNINFNAAVTATGTNAGLMLNYGGDYNVKAPITLSGSNSSLSINGNAYRLIRSMAQLDNIDNTGLSGRYALAQDLDASGTTYTSGLVGNFSGTFTGLGHIVSNLTISGSGSNVGLFKTNNGTLRDIGLVGGSVSGTDYTGMLAGYNNAGTITNAYATGTVSGANYVGGLAGVNQSGTITNAHATGTVSGTTQVGGLVGYQGGTITNAYATGTVSGTSTVGGLVGYNVSGTISNAFATGTVSGTNQYVGGLVGMTFGGRITNTYATGSVSGTRIVGGLVGYNYTGTISNAYATGSVSGANQYVGGLVGYNYTGTISNAYATGSVSGTSDVGGLVGYNRNGSTITVAYATGTVSGVNFVGGLAGENYGSVTASFWLNSVTANGFGAQSGTVDGVTRGLSGTDFTSAATYTAAGWNASNVGGDGTAWRIYERNTGPLLRSFMTGLALADSTVTYNGSTQYGATTSDARVLGGSNASARSAGSYTHSYYSGQQGVDIIGGGLTVSPANLVLTTSDVNKTYDGDLTASGTAAATAALGQPELVACYGGALAAIGGIRIPLGGGGSGCKTNALASGRPDAGTLLAAGTLPADGE